MRVFSHRSWENCIVGEPHLTDVLIAISDVLAGMGYKCVNEHGRYIDRHSIDFVVNLRIYYASSVLLIVLMLDEDKLYIDFTGTIAELGKILFDYKYAVLDIADPELFVKIVAEFSKRGAICDAGSD